MNNITKYEGKELMCHMKNKQIIIIITIIFNGWTKPIWIQSEFIV